MVQGVERGQELGITQTPDPIQGQEEDQQGPMDQEEEHQQEGHHLQEEALQDQIPAAIRHRSRQEEQAVQEEHHLVNLQVYLHPDDIPIHGLHWTDLGKLYRSYPCLLTTRVAAYWTCNSC